MGSEKKPDPGVVEERIFEEILEKLFKKPIPKEKNHNEKEEDEKREDSPVNGQQ